MTFPILIGWGHMDLNYLKGSRRGVEGGKTYKKKLNLAILTYDLFENVILRHTTYVLRM